MAEGLKIETKSILFLTVSHQAAVQLCYPSNKPSCCFRGSELHSPAPCVADGHQEMVFHPKLREDERRRGAVDGTQGERSDVAPKCCWLSSV